MRVYIIGNDGIRLCREAPATINDGEAAIASKEELHAAPLNGATIGMNLPSELFTGAFNDNRRIDPAGIRYDELPAEGRERLEALLGTYIGRIRPGHSEIRWAEVKRQLSQTHFAWVGSFDDASPFYYRILSPVILVEFDHQSGIIYDSDKPSRDHIHTVVRTPNGNDYGKDLLRQHYARHDHSHPMTAHRQGAA